MIEVKFGNTVLKMYASIKELPIWLSKRQQMYAMQAVGIGNSVADWDMKVAKAIQYLENKRAEDAATELNNIRLAVYSTLQQLDYKNMAFACMVASENGEPLTDYSEAALQARLTAWGAEGLTVGDVEDVLDDLKKNLIPNA